jgi:subtilase family serine protease
VSRKAMFAVIASAITMSGLAAVAAGEPAGAVTGPRDIPLAGSSAAFTSHDRALGAVSASARLSIQVWLKPDVAAAQAFATEVSTPGAALFHHYLSPDSYASRFGASDGEAASVETWLRGQGFTSVQAGPQRSYVRAAASAASIDAAFHTKLELYQASAQAGAGSAPLRANDGALSIPATLAGSVLGVTGLDNAAPVMDNSPQVSPGAGSTRVDGPDAGADTTADCSQYYGQHTITGQPAQFGTTTFPTETCGYSASQIRAAYGANFTNTGKGQTIALVELGLTQDGFLDLQDYAAANHLPAPARGRYREVAMGPGTCGDPFATEEPEDVQAAYDMAPGANEVVVGGDACDDGDLGLQGLFDADQAVLGGSGDKPLASIASNSWESDPDTQPVSWTDIEHAILLQAAAEGVGMYFSSGDASGVFAPSDDPLAVAVGGTTLGIGQRNQRLFETGWSTGIEEDQGGQWVLTGEQGASGGGPSLVWSQPSYQQGVVPAALSNVGGDRGGPVRVTPDISADADFSTGFAVGQLTFSTSDPSAPPTYSERSFAGTSLSAPLVAGIMAAAQQGQAKPFGFADPLLYKLAGTSAIADVLPLSAGAPAAYHGVVCETAAVWCHTAGLTVYDDQSTAFFDTGDYDGQTTTKGYDNMTGLGTPNGQKFIAAVRALTR